MGRACRICDRKFFLQATFQTYAVQINQLTNQAQVCDEDCEDVQADLDEVNDQRAQVEAMIREEEQRYNAADLNQKAKLEKIQHDQDAMRQKRDTLQQQLRLRQDHLSKMKRELTDYDIKKEELNIQLRRENVKLRESTMAVEQLNSQVSLHKSLNDVKFERVKKVDNVRTLIESEAPQIKEFDVIESTETYRRNSKNSRSVGGKSAYQSIRLPMTEEPVSEDELADEVPGFGQIL